MLYSLLNLAYNGQLGEYTAMGLIFKLVTGRLGKYLPKFLVFSATAFTYGTLFRYLRLIIPLVPTLTAFFAFFTLLAFVRHYYLHCKSFSFSFQGYSSDTKHNVLSTHFQFLLCF